MGEIQNRHWNLDRTLMYDDLHRYPDAERKRHSFTNGADCRCEAACRVYSTDGVTCLRVIEHSSLEDADAFYERRARKK